MEAVLGILFGGFLLIAGATALWWPLGAFLAAFIPMSLFFLLMPTIVLRDTAEGEVMGNVVLLDVVLLLVALGFHGTYGGWFNITILGIACGVAVLASFAWWYFDWRSHPYLSTKYILACGTPVIGLTVVTVVLADPFVENAHSSFHQYLIQREVQAQTALKKQQLQAKIVLNQQQVQTKIATKQYQEALRIAAECPSPEVLQTTLLVAAKDLREKVHLAASRGQFQEAAKLAAESAEWFVRYSKQSKFLKTSPEIQWTRLMLKMALLQSDSPKHREMAKTLAVTDKSP